MRSLRSALVLSAAATVSLVACTPPAPDVAPINHALGTLAPLTFAATVAKAAVDGEAIACATNLDACTGDGECAGQVSIDVSACTFPLEGDAAGAILVNGVFRDGFSGLVVDTSDVTVDGRRLRAPPVTPVILEGDGEDASLFYVMQGPDAEFDGEPPTSITDLEEQLSGTSGASQKAFIVDVDNGGTAADPSDDVWSITGGGQNATADADDATDANLTDTGAEVEQVALADVVWDLGACRRNPVEGTAVLNQVEDLESGAEIFSFHAACDGAMELDVGASLGALGTLITGDDTIALDLLREQ